MENLDNLVGPKSEDREVTIEGQTADGKMLYEAFLDPEALQWTKEEVEDAKNRLQMVASTHPEVIKMCTHKSIEECRSEISKAA